MLHLLPLLSKEITPNLPATSHSPVVIATRKLPRKKGAGETQGRYDVVEGYDWL